MPRNIYKLKSGEIVPGVTTIVNQLDKGESLLNWAWECGKKGKDWKEERDSAGDIGTYIHEIVLSYLSHEETIIPAEQPIKNCFYKFHRWWHKLELDGAIDRIVEKQQISEKLCFGGQPDLVYELKGKWILCDIKTSGGIYESYWYQLAGYDILLRENGYKVDEYQILWLSKDDRFDCPIRTDLRREKRIFKHLLGIYKERREQ
jgi:CRISPR/Cas system-associated exonuclease Cas4 (RecB family)